MGRAVKVNELKKILNDIDFPDDAHVMAKVNDDFKFVTGVWTNPDLISGAVLINVLSWS